MKAAILTISTSRAAGEAEDRGGPALAGWAESIGAEVSLTATIADDRGAIAGRLRDLADRGQVDLILTTGGTGFAPADLTPEATRQVIVREAPGIAEAMRAASAAHTPHWMLSRAVAGIRGRVLIVNFPGNPKAIAEAGEAIAAALPHAVALLREEPAGH